MTQALYRKWRPQLWDEVISQEHIVQTLKNAVASNRIAHAYLFSGPRGTGKTTAARLLAKAVNCLNSDTGKRPCNECAHCVGVNENRFMDLIEIDAASNNGVDDVRELRDKINFSPSQGTYRVYIIDEVHMLSSGAFNALLKTLEEPPPHAIFILATTEIHKIPATVLSRCQRHEFRRVPVSEITRHLNDICKAEGIEVDQDALNSIARQASGGMRDAISLLDQLASTGGKITLELAQTVLGTATNQSVLALIQAIIDQQPGAGLNEIHHALDGGADARSLARQIVDYLRNIMLIQMKNADQVEVSNDVRSQMVTHATALPISEVLRLMRVFNAAATDQRSGWTPSLGLELAFAESLEPPTPVLELASTMRAAVSKPATVQQVEPARTQPTVRQNPITAQAQARQVEESRPVMRQPVDTSREQDKPEESHSTAISQPDTRSSGTQDKASSPISAAKVGSVTMEQVSKAWKEISHLVKSKDPQSAALINSGRIIEIRDGVLIISFQGEILQQKFDRPENLDITRKAIQKVLGVDLLIQTVVSGNKNALPAHVKPDGMVAAASELGGEIVDIQKT
jgi:DNA polymerase-3 subunit gamma/tau